LGERPTAASEATLQLARGQVELARHLRDRRSLAGRDEPIDERHDRLVDRQCVLELGDELLLESLAIFLRCGIRSRIGPRFEPSIELCRTPPLGLQPIRQPVAMRPKNPAPRAGWKRIPNVSTGPE
jgi:hypothetical protein